MSTREPYADHLTSLLNANPPDPARPIASSHRIPHIAADADRPAIPTSNSGSLHDFVASAAPAPSTRSRDVELKSREDRMRHRQSVLLEQTNELQQLEKRLQAAEARKRELESRGGFV